MDKQSGYLYTVKEGETNKEIRALVDKGEMGHVRKTNTAVNKKFNKEQITLFHQVVDDQILRVAVPLFIFSFYYYINLIILN